MLNSLLHCLRPARSSYAHHPARHALEDHPRCDRGHCRGSRCFLRRSLAGCVHPSVCFTSGIDADRPCYVRYHFVRLCYIAPSHLNSDFVACSAATTKDDHEGVAGSFERARKGDEDQPDSWLVSSCLFSLPSAHMAWSGISSEGYKGTGYITEK